MRFQGTCFRAHDPRWSFKPISGDGAALYGGRFNPKGTPALYLSLTIVTALKEANQGFPHKIDPCVLCMYHVDCDDVADLRSSEARDRLGVPFQDMACAWFAIAAEAGDPPSWQVARRMRHEGYAGVLVPSFVRDAADDDHNLVLWSWSDKPPHKVSVSDPSGKLPKNQLSWR